jgi:glutathione S-transferase
MLKLYTAPGACSTACHIVLQESGVPFETKVLSFEGNDFESKDFLKMNPKGYVPFLEIDSQRSIAEGTAIMQYVADQAPESNLMPTKGFERYKGLEWLNFIATECHKTFGSFFMVDTIFKNEEGKKEYVEFTTAKMKDKLDFINASLEGKDYLMGKTFTVADAYLFTIMNWSQHLKFDLSPWKNVVNFQNRVYARPATQRAFKAEGLLK